MKNQVLNRLLSELQGNPKAFDDGIIINITEDFLVQRLHGSGTHNSHCTAGTNKGCSNFQCETDTMTNQGCSNENCC